MRLSFLLIYLLLSFSARADDLCPGWFKNTRIKPGSSSCTLDCVSSKVDMGTFDCPGRCDEFCDASTSAPTLNQSLQKLVYFSGLTPAEIKLIALHPDASITVYKMKGLAEHAVDKWFTRDRTDTESDAFRHFMWSGLLRQNLGRDLAQQYTDAHESTSDSSDLGSAMDRANNSTGITESENIMKAGNWSEDRLEKRGIELLRDHKLVVISPGNAPQESPHEKN